MLRPSRSRRLTFHVAMSVLVWLAPATQADAQDVTRMDQTVQSFVATKTFMGSVLVARDGEVLLSKGYGSANLEWEIPNTPSTKFRLGSITKQFTAASILLLEERGKLRVEDPVKKYLPDAPAAWEKITILHLLTHTAGLPNFTSFPDYPSTQGLATTPEKLVARFRDKPLEFEPGEKWNYSNSGYVLLGYLIERISGQSYEMFVHQNIFSPLSMTDSGYDSNTTVIPRRAAGYAPGANEPVNAGFVHMSIPHAAGALYSTTTDLLKWERGLFGGQLLSASSLQKMTTPFKSEYAFGLMVHTVNGRKAIEHNGGIEGFNTQLTYYPESRVTVVALANLNGTAVGNIAAKLGALAHGDAVQTASERKEIALPRQTLTRYLGTYELQPGVNLLVTLDGDQLTGQMSGQGKLPLFAESETRFFLKVVDAQLEFISENGKVVAVVLHQGGRDVRAVRSSDTVREREEISVAPGVLAQYVGSYELRPGLDLVVTLEGNQLMTQATGQGKFPVFPESETRFFGKAIDVQIEFGKDETGKATYLTLHQGPANIKAPRK
jgi:CubicO group peptidase (beta-lactamase class C family)